MEKKHRRQMLEKFSVELQQKTIIILDIPDEYKFMAPELMKEIRLGVESYFE